MTDEERQKLRVAMLEQLAALVQPHPLPREHQDPSKWVSKEDVERAHAAQPDADLIGTIERLTERVEQLEKTVEALGRM